MNWINSLFIRFKNRLASDLVAELQERNAKLLKANGILYDKCNSKDANITRIKSRYKFELDSTIETKIRVWIRENKPFAPEELAMAKRIIGLLFNETKLEKPAKKIDGPIKKLEKSNHKGLSKGYRRK